MSVTRAFLKLTHAGALQMLAGAVAKAEELGVPQNVSIVDDGGNLLAFVRMDGARLLSRETSMSKAVTAASHSQPTSRLSPADEVKLSPPPPSPSCSCCVTPYTKAAMNTSWKSPPPPNPP